MLSFYWWDISTSFFPPTLKSQKIILKNLKNLNFGTVFISQTNLRLLKYSFRGDAAQNLRERLPNFTVVKNGKVHKWQIFALVTTMGYTKASGNPNALFSPQWEHFQIFFNYWLRTSLHKKEVYANFFNWPSRTSLNGILIYFSGQSTQKFGQARLVLPLEIKSTELSHIHYYQSLLTLTHI